MEPINDALDRTVLPGKLPQTPGKQSVCGILATSSTMPCRSTGGSLPPRPPEGRRLDDPVAGRRSGTMLSGRKRSPCGKPSTSPWRCVTLRPPLNAWTSRTNPPWLLDLGQLWRPTPERGHWTIGGHRRGPRVPQPRRCPARSRLSIGDRSARAARQVDGHPDGVSAVWVWSDAAAVVEPHLLEHSQRGGVPLPHRGPESTASGCCRFRDDDPRGFGRVTVAVDTPRELVGDLRLFGAGLADDEFSLA